MTIKEINLFKKQGFVNFGSIIFSKKECKELKEITNHIYSAISTKHPDFIQDPGVLGVENLPLHDKEILKFINKIVSHSSIKCFLDDILGKNYKIWDISLRRSSVGDMGLYMHQDGVGQVNMIINLDNNTKGEGASAILPSSHLILKSQVQLKLKMPRFFTNLFSILFMPLSGSEGDILFFSNKAWHGRFSNKSNEDHDVIFVGFFPKGYSYSYNSWPKELIKKNSTLYISNLLASSSDYKKAVKVSNTECRESGDIYFSSNHGYSMDIEKYDYLIKEHRPFKLILSVFFIRCMIFVSDSLRIAYKFIKANKFFKKSHTYLFRVYKK